MLSVDPRLLSDVLGRKTSLFADAVNSHSNELTDAIKGSNVLIIGAAGSVGSAFAKQVADYRPSALHLVDIDENGLVEVVRDLQSTRSNFAEDFQIFSIGLGSPEFDAFLGASNNYDAILNFAALKHVRAERDPYSMLRMLNTNVVYLDDMLSQLTTRSSVKRVFSVSSDKSVNPASAMGSSKTLMEEVLWLHSERYMTSSARFANVAFSAGSLLEGFLMRLSKCQPLAGPTDVRRFFTSHEEAGQLCLLGAFLSDNREVVFPGLSPQDDMLTFSEIGIKVLEHFGYEPEYCASDAEARAKSARLTPGSIKRWPVHFSSSDTSGEKMYEEFFTPNDEVDSQRWPNVGVLRTGGLSELQSARLREGMQRIRDLSHSRQFDKAALMEVIRPLVKGLEHVETGTSLDAKM